MTIRSSHLDLASIFVQCLGSALRHGVVPTIVLSMLLSKPVFDEVCFHTRGAALRIEDVAGIVLGLLPALDAVPFALSIDPASPVKPAATAAELPDAAAGSQPATANGKTTQWPAGQTGSTAQSGGTCAATSAGAAAVASSAASAALAQNGGFLASFSGLLCRRGSPAGALQLAVAAGSPSKGSRC